MLIDKVNLLDLDFMNYSNEHMKDILLIYHTFVKKFYHFGKKTASGGHF